MDLSHGIWEINPRMSCEQSCALGHQPWFVHKRICCKALHASMSLCSCSLPSHLLSPSPLPAGVHLPPEGLPAFNKGDLISIG
jgi:hypothetical protein